MRISVSPTSEQWSDAIERGATYRDAAGTFRVGKRVGWTWSTSSRGTFQTTEPMAPQYRPVAIGYLCGPGI